MRTTPALLLFGLLAASCTDDSGVDAGTPESTEGTVSRDEPA